MTQNLIDVPVSLNGNGKKTNMEKRKPKGAIKFKISLNDEQKLAKARILQSRVALISGKAGSGKTMLAVNVGLDMLFKREIEKIYLIRSTVATEDIGFLPGLVNEKMSGWLMGAVDNMHNIYDKEKIEKLIKDGLIEYLPIQFARGITYHNSLAIVEECQNMTEIQLELLLTRIGVNGKIILTGDVNQIDLKNKEHSGLNTMIKICDNIKGFEHIELKTNHRDPIVEEIIAGFRKVEAEKKKN